jgi:hypothetical protein
LTMSGSEWRTKQGPNPRGYLPRLLRQESTAPVMENKVMVSIVVRIRLAPNKECGCHRCLVHAWYIAIDGAPCRRRKFR